METNKEKTTSKSETQTGFDFSSLLGTPGIAELIKHLLSGGGAALLNYLVSIKPLQEKVQELENENKELKKRLREVEDNQDEIVRQVKKKFSEIDSEELNDDDDFFRIRKKESPLEGRRRKYTNQRF